MTNLYLEILDTKRKEVFAKISAFGRYGYLAGGTALALQLGHRKSFDFDIFIPRPLSRRFFMKVVDVFGENISTRVNTGDLLLVTTEENIDIHFGHYWFERLKPLIKTNSISLASVEDIAADKAYTIGRRGQWRDYVDIFCLMKKGVLSLDEIIQKAEKKFRPGFNPRLFLQQLVYYGDISDYTMEFFRERFAEDEIKTFLKDEAERLMNKMVNNK